MDVGPVIKTLRKALNLSQEQLAERCGILRTDVTLVETGRNQLNSYDKRSALTRGLGITLEEFDGVIAGTISLDAAQKLVVQRAAEA